jgi:nucleotide-binding universal stress UspA family protein
LEAAAAELKVAGSNVSIDLRVGEAAETIRACRDEVRADLSAMSTHGRSGMPRRLLGSVAEKVVHGAKIPVLLLRPPKQADAVPAPSPA